MKLGFLSLRLMRLAPLALVLSSTAAIVVACLQALDYPFIFDDNDYITNNSMLAELRLAELWKLLAEPYNPYEFLPLRDFSYWLDLTIFGLIPSAFRIHNIFLYLLSLPLIYATTSNLWRHFRPAETDDTPWIAAITTALFAIHPAHVEAVVWISGRKDVLSGLFAMLAILLATKTWQGHKFSTPYAIAAMAALLAAMFSKITAIAVAPVISVLWLAFWRNTSASTRSNSMLLWPLASLLLAACALLLFIPHSLAISPRAYFGMEMISRALGILGWLARLAATPESRHFSYPLFDGAMFPIMVSLGATVFIAAIAGLVSTLRKRSLAGFALVSFLLLCTPYLQLIPFQTFSPVSDRFLFIAVWPIILLFVSLVWHLNPWPRAILLLLIALPLIFQATQRPREWNGYEMLLDADLRAYPDYYVPAFQKIGCVQIQHGTYSETIKTANGIKFAEIRNIIIKLIDASFSIRVAAQITGSPVETVARLRELGMLLKQPPPQTQWDPSFSYVWDESKRWLRHEWEDLSKSFPYDAEVRYYAGIHMLDNRHYEDAAVHFRAAIQSRNLPDSLHRTAFTNLGHALLKSGRAAEAETTLRTALTQQQPDVQTYCLLAELYKQGNRAGEARQFESHCLEAAREK